MQGNIRRRQVLYKWEHQKETSFIRRGKLGGDKFYMQENNRRRHVLYVGENQEETNFIYKGTLKNIQCGPNTTVEKKDDTN